MHRTNVFTFENSTRIMFRSGDPRQPIRDDEKEEHLSDNNYFPLHVVSPTLSPSLEGEQDSGDVFIVLCGFNDGVLAPNHELQDGMPIDTYNSPNFGLCTLLSQMGYGSVLLPLPFHYWRKPSVGPYSTSSFTPSHMIYEHPIRFYLGYKQTLIDVDHLANMLKFPAEHGISLPFRVDRIHLLGYSLGGLASVSAFVLDSLKSNPVYASCSMLFSGSAITRISGGIAGLSTVMSNQIKSFYQTYEYLKPEHSKTDWEAEKETKRLDAFQHFLIEQRHDSMTRQFGRVLNSIHIILGQRDTANRLQGALKLVENVARPLLHVVPGGGHILFLDAEWKRLGARISLDWVGECITTERRPRHKEDQ